jgi:hypothetical protein
VLHSDVANHAYQNSNYSPYSGQQHGEISRTMQAAAVVHMTSGNRGELGKNAIPNAQKQTLKALNKAVNKIYKAYEKVANKVIDDLTQKTANGKNGNGLQMGAQQLGESFRSAEKGATSTKRLKTTTYVPSFDTAGYAMNTINNAIAQRTGGNKAKYKDLLSTANTKTGKQYIQIYTATMNQMLPAFKKAEKQGISYMESVKMVPCSTMAAGTLKTLSSAANNQATACCKGNMLNTQPGGCGATLKQKTLFRKKNANGNNDGGAYSGREYILNRYMSLYQCPRACMFPISQQKTADSGLLAPVIKTETGTCVNYLSTNGCTTTANDQYTKCQNCAGIFNNVAPNLFASNFVGKPVQGGPLGKMLGRLSAAPEDEPMGNVLSAGGEDLGLDNTAECHTPSTFKCPGKEADFEKDVNAGKCNEVESHKVDDMCDDGPCDNDENSQVCLNAKARCLVDPETGSMCMPGNENDPCKDCVRTASSGNAVALAFTTLFVGLASTML